MPGANRPDVTPKRDSAGNASTDFLWGGSAGFHTVWPDSPDNAAYRTVRPRPVETLLVGGELDFSTPPVNATKELLPTLSRGHQVVLPGLGHTHDFWEHQPEAGKHLLTTFSDTGHGDSSQFDRRPVAFDAVPLSMPTIAALLVGIPTGGVLIGLLVLGLLLRRRLRRGAPSGRASRWIRALTMVPLGLAGWFLGVLFTWTLAPGWVHRRPGRGGTRRRTADRPRCAPRPTDGEARTLVHSCRGSRRGVRGSTAGIAGGNGAVGPGPRNRRRRAGREPRSGVPTAKPDPSSHVESVRGDNRFNCMRVISTVLYMQL